MRTLETLSRGEKTRIAVGIFIGILGVFALDTPPGLEHQSLPLWVGGSMCLGGSALACLTAFFALNRPIFD